VGRYHSSRLALVAGLISIFIWFSYELLANHQLRWDLIIIAGVMALTKIIAMLYYRSTH
jgi:low affinity Fe/Cu permease